MELGQNLHEHVYVWTGRRKKSARKDSGIKYSTQSETAPYNTFNKCVSK
jgi:hypothetical protein